MRAHGVGRTGPLILDGRSHAERRAPFIARRAAAVHAQRGRAPALLLVAFADAHGRVPHLHGKLRACEAAGVDAAPLIVGAGKRTAEIERALRNAVHAPAPDAVFVQVPFPHGIDGDALAAAIPCDADVDVMTPQRFADYMSDADALPPVTVAAALLLLDAYDLSAEGRAGIVVAEKSPFALMFREALRRRGAAMAPIAEPQDPDLPKRVGESTLVVAAAGRPALLATAALAPGAVAIDAGYFNPGGRGDLDTTTGTGHLAALMPVPGGIGPMTVSALVERVVAFAERACGR